MKSEVSALMDGELDEKTAAALLAQMKQEDELLASWNTFHAISDALHETYLHSPHFREKFRERLAKEPTILAPPPRRSPKPLTYLLSAAASIAAVAFVFWSVQFRDSGPTQLARQETVLKGAPQSLPVHDYLIAHQEFSPSTAMQGVAPYVRTVSLNGADPVR